MSDDRVPDPLGPMPECSNALALWTLYWREVRRFLKVYTQTVVAPVITSLLFLAVFALAIGPRVDWVSEVPFLEFLAPGLIMMQIIQNAFANTSSSVMIAKVQGNIVDTLMPPLTAHELTIGIALGGATRGVIVGAAVAVAMALLVGLGIAHPLFILFHGVAGAILLSLLGTMGGIWAVKFDHIAAVTNFVVMPLSFLSGTFYSIERLPESFQFLAHINPFFYMIDGFRYGFIGTSDSTPWVGVLVMAAVDLALWLACWRMIASGYKLKA